jgi:hypothetical protein
MLGLEIGHIGINHPDNAEAQKTAQMLSLLMGKAVERESEKGMFVGSQFEVMKSMGPGKCGHIAVLTNNVERAIYHLSRKGIAFNEESATFNEDGTRKFIYLTFFHWIVIVEVCHRSSYTRTSFSYLILICYSKCSLVIIMQINFSSR